ncbi:ParM/StbA family protein [Vibrio metschnikovii]|nr:ParM/StbA family protein [Vibrio metschnikovii]
MHTQSEEVISVVVDDGHFNLKGVMLGEKGEIARFVKPSLIMSGHSNAVSTISADKYNKDFETIDKDGNPTYFTAMDRLPFGQNSMLVDTQNQKFQLSEANRILVHAMLHHMGLEGKKVHLITTSPMQRYFRSSGEIDSRYIDERNANLMVPVYTKDGKQVEIVQCEQVPEGFATYLSMLLKYNQDSKKISIDGELIHKDILILDFGGQTLDVAVISGNSLLTDKSFTEEGVGMLKIYDHMYDYLKSYRQNISRVEMSDIIESGQFYTDKKQTNLISVADEVEKAIRNVLTAGLDKVSKRVPFNNFDKVIVTGGSAIVLAKYLKVIIDETEHASDPLFSNAIGALINHIREKRMAVVTA